MRTIIKCQSGLKGWQARLQEVYADFESFQAYAETYEIHTKLGYKTPVTAWRANPIMQGSVEPGDSRGW
jgi:hypothetical protein